MKKHSNTLSDNTPRILSLVDRNPNSPTNGCCDRQYWHYKTTDFSNARFQEAGLSLALIYKNSAKGNVYKNDNFLKIIESIMNFWVKTQNKNGSFSESIPKENSFVATAFSSNAAAETLKILNIRPANIITSLEKSAHWLSKYNDLEVSNHQAGAVRFFYNMYELTGNEKYKTLAKDKLNTLLNIQSKEGWFPEYGGPDAGYLSLTINFLSSYFEAGNDNDVIEPINRAKEYLSHFIYPDGTFGGEIFSRNSEIFFTSDQNISHLDDRYLIWLSSLQINLDIKPKKNFEIYFDESGIFVHSDKKYYIVCNLKKGGAIKVFKNGKLVYSDCGLVAKHKKNILTNCIYGDYETKLVNSENEKYAEIRGYMYKTKPMRLSPLRNSAIRVLTSIGFSDYVVHQAKRKLITGAQRTNIRFERRIDFSDPSNVKIEDKVNSKINFEKAKKAPFMHTASSGFFKESDLE